MDFGSTLLRWWPVICAFAAMGWYISKSIQDLKAHNDKQDTQIAENSKKITSLFDFYNALINRRLDKLDKLEDKE
jgi:hypothetical protein